ncbi:MAG: hypothetical protein ABIQ15_16080 [Nocardioides sp.]
MTITLRRATMHDRSLLGPADVSDAQLTAMVADLLGHPTADVCLTSSTAEPVDYDLPAITTASRHWVSGTARTPTGESHFRIFVKHVQSWERHPFFAEVHPEIAELAAAGVPWRTEPLAYRSDLGDRLPDGLTMPRALGVFDLDELSAAIWLEEVRAGHPTWDLDRYRRAAYLLGQLAASPRVAERRNVGDVAWTVQTYVSGRLQHQVLPMLAADELWQHPLVAGAFEPALRGRLRTEAELVQGYADELMALPQLAAHGDASPNNLLAGPTPGSFVLIDYGFWLPNVVGFDLGQLLVGDVQIGKRSPDLLVETDEAIVPAYVDGLRAEGLDVEESTVRRAHALHLLLFTGLSTLPFELLDQPPTPEAHAAAAARASIARFSLDLLDAAVG